tara:strand:+ start:123 stop:704 length:582 start_codon:yes stop_codon:yes gene_type:complete
MDLQKLLKIVAAAVGVISIIFLITIISTGDDAIKAGESSASVDLYMKLAYLVYFLALFTVVIFGYKSKIVRLTVAIFILLNVIVSFIMAFFSIQFSFVINFIPIVILLAKFIDLVLDFPKSKSMLIGVSSFTLLALICYFIFASGTETVLKDGSILTTSQSKLVGAGLYLFYVLSFVATVIMLFFGVKKSLNK